MHDCDETYREVAVEGVPKGCIMVCGLRTWQNTYAHMLCVCGQAVRFGSPCSSIGSSVDSTTFGSRSMSERSAESRKFATPLFAAMITLPPTARLCQPCARATRAPRRLDSPLTHRGLGVDVKVIRWCQNDFHVDGYRRLSMAIDGPPSR